MRFRLIIATIVIFIAVSGYSGERVIRLQITTDEASFRPSVVIRAHNGTDNAFATRRFHNQSLEQVIEEGLAGVSFVVYTTAEVDQKLSERATTAALSETENRVDRKIGEFETRIRTEVVQELDELPQRVLMQEAGQALKDAILQELRQELAQLRDDLRAEINALRNE